jgi:hypothetical protein
MVLSPCFNPSDDEESTVAVSSTATHPVSSRHFGVPLNKDYNMTRSRDNRLEMRAVRHSPGLMSRALLCWLAAGIAHGDNSVCPVLSVKPIAQKVLK